DLSPSSSVLIRKRHASFVRIHRVPFEEKLRSRYKDSWLRLTMLETFSIRSQEYKSAFSGDIEKHLFPLMMALSCIVSQICTAIRQSSWNRTRCRRVRTCAIC